MESNENFIKVSKNRIIAKKYIYDIYAIDEHSSIIILCYPGMHSTEVKVYETIETIYQHL